MKKWICCFISAMFLLSSLVGCSHNNKTMKKVYFKPTEYDYSVQAPSYEQMNLQSDFKSKYVNTPFYNDRDDEIVYTLNYLYDIFALRGTVSNIEYGFNNTPYAVQSLFGNEPCWYEWNVEKIMWYSNADIKEDAKKRIVEFPQSQNGFMWSWGDRTYWEVGEAVSYHYDGTFRFIGSVYDVLVWENDLNFLDKVDNTQVEKSTLDNQEDASFGRSVWQKVQMAMDYILQELNGKNGIIILPYEEGNVLKNNSGKVGSNSSNYWDNLCFGNYSGYENALFYNTLIKYAGILKMKGESKEAEYYEKLAVKVKENYDKYFWSETTGRYINTIDTDGNKVDLGLTFQNSEALCYGLGDKTKAESILSWYDGTRTVETDTVQDVYKYGFAPRTNTVSIETTGRNVDGKKLYWWHAPSAISVAKDNGSGSTNAGFEKHEENGCFIFYTEYYDLMARLKYGDIKGAFERYQAITDLYKETRFSAGNSKVRSGWSYGIINEFPENGLVPTSYIHGVLGINASYRGLEINPKLPQKYNYAGTTDLTYGGNVYDFRVDRDNVLTFKTKSGVINFKAFLKDNSKYTNFEVRILNNAGEEIKVMQVEKTNGEVAIDCSNIYREGTVIVSPLYY